MGLVEWIRLILYQSSDNVEKRILNELEKNSNKKSSFFNSYNDIFIGNIQNGKFNFRRRGYGNTSIIPEVYGKIRPGNNENQSIIEIIVTPNILIKAFMIFWYGILSLLILGVFIQSLLNLEFNFALLILPIFILVGYGIVYIGFTTEFSYIKEFFGKLMINLE